MAATWIKSLHVNSGKSIAKTIAERTDYIKNPEKTIEKIINDSKNYIMNPNKTYGGELVRGYACNPKTVDVEFLISKREYEYITGRNQGKRDVLAYE